MQEVCGFWARQRSHATAGIFGVVGTHKGATS